MNAGIVVDVVANRLINYMRELKVVIEVNKNSTSFGIY